MRELEIWINEIRVGSLSEQNGLWSLTYSSEWIRSPASYALAPSLPLWKQPSGS